ncbi:MAG: glycosyltransferase [Gammaproteobacteria bacterium]
MKILHLETGMHLYGGAQQVLYLLDALRDDASEHVLVAAQGSEVVPAALEAGHRVIEVPARGDHDLPLVGRLTRLLAEEQPDILHAHSRRGADLLGGLAARRSGIRAVVSRRVDNPEPAWLAALRYRHFDRIVAISDAIEGVLLDAGIDRQRIVVIPDCVDPAPFAGPGDRQWLAREFGLPADVPVAGVVAQLIERKGHRHLLDAMPAVLAACPELHVLFFGRGPLEASLRQEIGRRGLAERVMLAGFRTDMPRILPALDLVVHPATAEGLGVSLLQAAAASVPVVGFAAGGICQAVESGRTGLLVPPGDTGALAQAMNRVLTEPRLARSLGRAGRKRVSDEFTPGRMAERHFRLYRTLLADPGGDSEDG